MTLVRRWGFLKSRVGKREDTLGGGDLRTQAQGRENGGILHAE